MPATHKHSPLPAAPPATLGQSSQAPYPQAFRSPARPSPELPQPSAIFQSPPKSPTPPRQHHNRRPKPLPSTSTRSPVSEWIPLKSFGAAAAHNLQGHPPPTTPPHHSSSAR